MGLGDGPPAGRSRICGRSRREGPRARTRVQLGRQRNAPDGRLPLGGRAPPLAHVMLRIGIDARELMGDVTGVGRYLGEILTRWTARTDAERRQFYLYAPEPLPLTFATNTTVMRVAGQGSGRGTWWEQTHLRRAIRQDPLDVFFA